MTELFALVSVKRGVLAGANKAGLDARLNVAVGARIDISTAEAKINESNGIAAGCADKNLGCLKSRWRKPKEWKPRMARSISMPRRNVVEML